ncbi:unnamed protein product [Urochloa humidicola]
MDRSAGEGPRLGLASGHGHGHGLPMLVPTCYACARIAACWASTGARRASQNDKMQRCEAIAAAPAPTMSSGQDGNEGARHRGEAGRGDRRCRASLRPQDRCKSLSEQNQQEPCFISLIIWHGGTETHQYSNQPSGLSFATLQSMYVEQKQILIL